MEIMTKNIGAVSPEQMLSEKDCKVLHITDAGKVSDNVITYDYFIDLGETGKI